MATINLPRDMIWSTVCALANVGSNADSRRTKPASIAPTEGCFSEFRTFSSHACFCAPFLSAFARARREPLGDVEKGKASRPLIRSTIIDVRTFRRVYDGMLLL